MKLDRSFSNAECGSDGCVGHPSRHQLKNLAFAGGEAPVRGGRCDAGDDPRIHSFGADDRQPPDRSTSLAQRRQLESELARTPGHSIAQRGHDCSLRSGE